MSTKAKKDSVKEQITADIKDVAKELEKLSGEIGAETSKDTKVASDAVKKAATKAKTTAKTAAKQTADKAKATAKKVATNAKRKEVKKTAIVEFYGNQCSVEEIIEKAEKAYKSETKARSMSDIKVYIKPEDNAAYYVVDDKSAGKIDLF